MTTGGGLESSSRSTRLCVFVCVALGACGLHAAALARNASTCDGMQHKTSMSLMRLSASPRQPSEAKLHRPRPRLSSHAGGEGGETSPFVRVAVVVVALAGDVWLWAAVLAGQRYVLCVRLRATAQVRSSLHLRTTGGDTIRCRRPSLCSGSAVAVVVWMEAGCE